MYMKIVTDGFVRHLFLMDQVSDESKTLCGSILTQLQSWKRINSLEGDECPRCAELAFLRAAGRPEAKRKGEL